MYMRVQINTWKETNKTTAHIPAITLHTSLPIAGSEDLSQRRRDGLKDGYRKGKQICFKNPLTYQLAL